jgi:hypothetical protein
MIGMEEENNRFAQALQDDVLRERLMTEYAQRSKVYGWAAILQVALAVVLFFLPGSQQAYYVFLCVALGFLIISLRLRCDLKVLKLAVQPGVDSPATGFPPLHQLK